LEAMPRVARGTPQEGRIRHPGALVLACAHFGSRPVADRALPGRVNDPEAGTTRERPSPDPVGRHGPVWRETI
jgi:hypothetical protein